MMEPSAATREVPIYFPAGEETLFGVLAMPRSQPVQKAVVVLGGGNTPSPSTGRNGVFVKLCRRLSGAGYLTLRFDYHGSGESTGTAEFRLDRPFVKDLESAVEYVARNGINDSVLVGSCFGARTAISAGPRLSGLGGLVLLSPPLRDYGLSERKTVGWSLRDYLVCLVQPQRILGGTERVTARRYARFLQAGVRILGRKLVTASRLGKKHEPSWASKHFLDPLSELVEKNVPILFVYGTEDDDYQDFQEASQGSLGEILARGRKNVEVRVLPGRVHGFTQIHTQERILETIADWISPAILAG